MMCIAGPVWRTTEVADVSIVGSLKRAKEPKLSKKRYVDCLSLIGF